MTINLDSISSNGQLAPQDNLPSNLYASNDVIENTTGAGVYLGTPGFSPYVMVYPGTTTQGTTTPIPAANSSGIQANSPVALLVSTMPNLPDPANFTGTSQSILPGESYLTWFNRVFFTPFLENALKTGQINTTDQTTSTGTTFTPLESFSTAWTTYLENTPLNPNYALQVNGSPTYEVDSQTGDSSLVNSPHLIFTESMIGGETLPGGGGVNWSDGTSLAAGTNAYTTSVEQAFSNQFYTQMGGSDLVSGSQQSVPDFSNYQAASGTTSIVTNPLGSAADATLTTSQTLLNNTFNAFISSFSTNYQNNTLGLSTGQTTGEAFSNTWTNYLTTVAVLQNTSKYNTSFSQALSQDPNAANVIANLISYQTVYTAFHPKATHQQFLDALEGASGLFTSTSGVLTPSASLAAWYQGLEQGYNAVYTVSNDTRSQGQRTVIINQILALMVTMINTIQQVTATQADRLTFLSNWQNAYTNLMGQVPAWTNQGGNAGVMYIEASAYNSNLTQLVTNVNGPALDNLRNYQAVVANQAKTIQSNVNQGTDEASQQTSLAQTILQQLTTLLQYIIH